MTSELSYKRAFRASIGWSSAIEPGKGGDVGAPDLLVLVGNRLVGLELKLGSIGKNGFLHVKPPGIRPAQVSWHVALAQAGGFSLLAVGEHVKGNEWLTYLINGSQLRDWRQGFTPQLAISNNGLMHALEITVGAWAYFRKAS